MAVIYRISSTPNTGSAYILGSALSYTQLDGNFAYLLTNMSGSLVSITGSTSIQGKLTVSGGITASLQGTASYATSAGTASYFSGSISNAVSSSYALSSSFALSASYAPGSGTSVSASYALSSSFASSANTASYILNAVSSSYAATADNATSSSYALTASYANNASTANSATSASYAATATSSSYSTNTTSASYALTASYALNAPTASVSSSYSLSSSYAVTASYSTNTISASYALTASFAITSSYEESSSYAVSSSFASTANTASYILNAVSSSYALTASYALNAPTASISSSYSLSSSFAETASYANNASTANSATSASYALSSSFALTASYFSGSITNAISSSYAETSSLPLLGIVTASINASTITFTKGDQTTFDIVVAQSGSIETASYAIFAENAGSSSYALSSSFALSASYAPGSGTSVSASYSLSSSYALSASIANIQYVTNSGNLVLGGIEVADYDSNTAVTFTNGVLKFVFGTPAVPSGLAASLSGFLTDRFNQVTDNYTANGSWSNGGYTLISASLYEGSTLLTEVGSGTSLTYNTTTSGSHTYRLAYTASSPLDSSIYLASATTTGTLSKTNPGSPTISATPTIQLGATSNQFEQGATGSIAFTSASGAANGWVFNYGSSNVQSPYVVTGSLTGSTSITIIPTTYYSSSGVNGSDNSPALVTTATSTTTYTKIRSLRSGATATASYSQNDLEQLGNWDTTLGGTVGTIQKGTTTVTGQTVVINWTGSLYQYIVYDSARPNLTAINSSGFNVSASFTLTTTGSYKVYRTTALQSGYGGTTVTYTLV